MKKHFEMLTKDYSIILAINLMTQSKKQEDKLS